jgi:C-terminal processing protease CtpA/Prc
LGLVVRLSDPNDGRSIIVELTEQGQRTFDAVAPAHLANEERLLSALNPDQQLSLTELLRQLLVSFERPVVEFEDLGVTLTTAHEARRVRLDAGLQDHVGLLVTAVVRGKAAALAGLRRGDLIVKAGDNPVRCVNDVVAALHAADGQVAIAYLRADRRRSARLAVGRTSR